MAKVAFVSFARGPLYEALHKDFIFSVKRLGYDVYTFSTFEEIGSPTHQESPYEFKLHSIRTVYMKGYDIVIWCDSPIRLVRRITDWIPEIERRGVYLQEDGHALGTWANDKALAEFKLTRDQAMELQTVYACVMAFDFRHPMTKPFFYRWKDCADKGLFKGKWHNKERTESEDPRCKGHRHDQTCAELVARELGIRTSPRVLKGKEDSSRYFRSHWET